MNLARNTKGSSFGMEFHMSSTQCSAVHGNKTIRQHRAIKNVQYLWARWGFFCAPIVLFVPPAVPFDNMQIAT